jgi:hypothetical protein
MCILAFLTQQAFYPCLQCRCIPVVFHLYSHAKTCYYINRYIYILITIMSIINLLMCSYPVTSSRRSSNIPKDFFLIAQLGYSPTIILIHHRLNKLTLHILHRSSNHEELYICKTFNLLLKQ